MTIPYKQQAYGPSTGTVSVPAFTFQPRDPGLSDIAFPLYQGWVNTQTYAIWYLETLSALDGSITAQWRAVGPIVKAITSPGSGDYLYPIGQTWVNTVGETYWGLVNVTGTTATWVELSAGGSSGVKFLTGNTGGMVSPDGANNINILGSTDQVIVTGDPGDNTLTISLPGGFTALSQVEVDTSTTPGTDPVLSTSGGLITVTGGQVAAGMVGTNVIQTDSLAPNSYVIEIQRTAAVVSSNRINNGVSHFNDAQFTVDSNGFVSLQGGSGLAPIEEIILQSGTTSCVPTAGAITFNGATVAAGTVPVQTQGTPNTMALQVQTSQAISATDATKIGLSNFNSGDFTVDDNGFVSILSSTFNRFVEVDTSTPPGEDPVTPDSGGLITVTGGQIAAESTGNVIRTNSLIAHEWIVEIQQTTTASTSTPANNGVAHFNSSNFTVDGSGFVSLNGLTSLSTNTVVVAIGDSPFNYVPSTGTVAIIVEVIGGGGAGGGSGSASSMQASAGGGGGAGEYARGSFMPSSQTVTIGAGGIGVSADAGGDGGTTSFGAVITSFGGLGGDFIAPAAAVGAVGGLGGTGGSGGTLRTPGSCGYSNLGIGTSVAILIGGEGANSQYGAGAQAVNNSTGNSALGYGSGGGGSNSYNDGPFTGGAGAPGVCIITEYIS